MLTAAMLVIDRLEVRRDVTVGDGDGHRSVLSLSALRIVLISLGCWSFHNGQNERGTKNILIVVYDDQGLGL